MIININRSYQCLIEEIKPCTTFSKLIAVKELNIKVFNQLKLHHGLTGKYYAICHYSYNLPIIAVMILSLSSINAQTGHID